MNITIITSVLPYPLNSGGAQAQFNMIDMLRNEHNITLLFIETRSNQRKVLKELSLIWPNVRIISYSYLRQLRNFVFAKDKIARAMQMVFMKNRDKFEIKRAITQYGIYFTNDFVNFICRHIETSKSDIVQVEFYPCMHIVNYLPEKVKKLFIHHEIRFIRNERFLRQFRLTDKETAKKEAMKKQEIDDLNKYDSIVTLTSIDKDILVRNNVSVPIYVSPAAVKTIIRPYEKCNGNVVFVGGYGHLPNKEGIDWFINEVIPKMSVKVSLQIIGSGWPLSYESSNVKLLGFVDHLDEAICGSIMIVPILTGSGMRMKILEAAAMGVPFVTTSVGVEGLDFLNDDSCLIADGADAFAHALECLINDNCLCEKLARKASNVYMGKYSVEALSAVRNDIYYNIVD